MMNNTVVRLKAIKRNTVTLPQVMKILNRSWSMLAGSYVSKGNMVQKNKCAGQANSTDQETPK